MKIVVPVSNDKKTIYKRTGRAPYFAVYDNRQFLKTVENIHARKHEDNEHHEENSEEEVENHRKDISNIADCDIILVKTIGKNMAQALDSFGIKIEKIEHKDTVFAKDAVEAYINKSNKQMFS